MKSNKTLKLALGIVAASFAATGLALNEAKSLNPVSVSFDAKDSYSDISDDTIKTKKSEKRVLDEVSKSFRENASKYLPNGYELRVAVNDIDLAGDRSPLTSTFGEIRVLTSAFPPRIVFDYEVVDPNERVVASGSARLVNLNYQNDLRSVGRNSDSPAPYIDELIKQWSSRELRKAVNSIE
mgnify:CR=1 FL=1